MKTLHRLCGVALGCFCTFTIPSTRAEESASPPKAFVDGVGLGWRALGEENFINVNCDADTWKWTNGFAHCKGKPVGVIRSTVLHTNFELVVQWRHLQSGGNSGVFVWATPESIKALEQGKGRLPTGVEVQVLDLGYAEQYEKQTKRKPTGSPATATSSPPEPPP